jgi:hypothetical protein
VALRHELETLTSSLADIAARLSVIVENESDLSSDAYIELVAAERQVGTLLRRLQRVSNRFPQ